MGSLTDVIGGPYGRFSHERNVGGNRPCSHGKCNGAGGEYQHGLRLAKQEIRWLIAEHSITPSSKIHQIVCGAAAPFQDIAVYEREMADEGSAAAVSALTEQDCQMICSQRQS